MTAGPITYPTIANGRRIIDMTIGVMTVTNANDVLMTLATWPT